MANTKEVAMLFDSSHCTGCKGCQVACKQWNMLPSKLGLNENKFSGTYQNPPDLNGDTRLVMTFDEKESGNKYQPINFAIGRRSCYHCTDAACVAICSSGALYKKENGVVAYDTDKCNGCTYCQSACPFDVPRFRPMDGCVDKCTLCIDRLEEGGIPACVKTCQPEALKFGPRDEMIALGQKRVDFLKKKGFDKAELYGVNEMGGLHVLQVCQFGHEAYGLPTDPKPNKMIGMMNAMRTVTGVGTAAVLAGLAVSFVAATGYRREKVTVEEAKKHWTPEQRATADREVKELLEKEASGLENALEVLSAPSPDDDIRSNYKRFFDLARQYTTIAVLDRDTLLTFVEKIEVGPKILPDGYVRAPRKNAAYQQSVKIYYKFIGCLRLESLENFPQNRVISEQSEAI